MFARRTGGLLALALPFLAGTALAQPHDPASTLSEGQPPIVGTLGADRFVKLTGVNEAGKVVWFNWRLAEELGLELPRGGVMTPAFEAELVRHMSWRLLKEGEAAGGRPTVDMYADRYGGWGMGHNKGAGRAAFFGRYNLNIKGVGVTPLVSGATVYSHRHGGAPLKEGILEAVWGEVGTNLFEAGSTRILAVIDNGDYTRWEDGGKERRALIVRAGDQLRPAHLLAEGFTKPQNFETLVRMLSATGNLVRARGAGGREVVDLAASLKRVADKHAGTAAELYRWRILHGGLSPGNKSFDGGMLDLGTVTSQPRTAPVHVLDYTDGSNGVRADLRFDTENEWRVRDLEAYLETAKVGAGKPGYAFQSFDIAGYYRTKYRERLELQMLEAAGLDKEAARRLREADPDLAKRFTDSVRKLGALTNDVDMNIERNAVERGSVVDVFGALGGLAREHFAGRATPERTLELLKADADDPAKLATAKAEAATLADLHGKVLEGAFAAGGSLYDDRAEFERSVTSRAELENRGLDALNRKRLSERLGGLIADYETTGDPSRLRAEVETLASESSVDVDGLLRGSGSTSLEDGSLLTNTRAIEGLLYGVRSGADGARVVRVELPLRPVDGGGYVLETLGGQHVSASQVNGVDYRFTTDGWATHRDVRGVVGTGQDGKPALLFEAPVASGQLGSIEGLFHVLEGDWWVKSGERNFEGYRFRAPNRAELARLETELVHGEGAGFAPRRVLTMDEAARGSPLSRAELEAIFGRVRAAMAARARARVAELAPADRPAYEEHARRVASATLEVVTSNEVDARYDADANAVRVTTGVLNAIEDRARGLPEAERAAFRERSLGLVLGHELAHAAGIKAERTADLEGLRAAREAALGGAAMSEADVKRTLEAFEKTGSSSLLERARSFARYGTTGGREAALVREVRGEADPVARWRRADGTLDWKRMSRDHALTEVGGLANFGLALFLKELAVVARTGDRAKIEEFFDGLMTTDFYVQYGLFSLGARAGDVAFSRYLSRYVKPRFVNGVLRTNLVLATGLALPAIARGDFDGKAFAISLGSLGLSSAAVKAGVASLRWVVDLRRARTAGTVARTGLAVGRFANVAGWFYTAAETAVVLYLADDIEHAVRAHLDLAAARRQVTDAGRTFLRTSGDPAATPAAIAEAADRYHEAWTAYRDFLYAPLQKDEAEYAARLEGVARRAKIAEDERTAALSRLAAQPALARSVISRYGSLEAYAEARAKDDEAAIARDVETYTTSYTRARDAHLREIYEGNRRGTDLLSGLDAPTWLLAGARAGGAGDPWGDRTDPFARWGRSRAESALDDRLGAASTNRLETYDDEVAVLTAALRAMPPGPDRDARARALDATLALTRKTRALDANLAGGRGVVDTVGLRGALERTGR